MDRGWLDTRRWYTVDCFDSRDDALNEARKLRKANAFGEGHAFRVAHSNNRWCVQHAAGMTEQERKHGALFNRKALENERGQRKLF